MLLPGGNSVWSSLSTDYSRKFSAGVSLSMFEGDENSNNFLNLRLRLTWTPMNALNISIQPFYSKNNTLLQYIETNQMQGEDRYIFASLDQETIGVPLRINYGITPELTIQYYGQPFISAGKYTSYKMITDPKADKYQDRFRNYSEAQLSYNSEDEVYNVDEDLNETEDYSFDKPDFNAFYFISNLVIRWEYLPGSSVYLVWSQKRSDTQTLGMFRPGPDMEHLSTIYPHNVFLIKVSYRLGV